MQVVLHILVATYMFIGLAVICDDYFVPALTRVSDCEFNKRPPAAGVTVPRDQFVEGSCICY